MNKFRTFLVEHRNVVLLVLALVSVGPFICLFGWRNGADSDIWHVLSTGRYLIESGLAFPETEPISMHEGLDYVPQQWLYAIVLYGAYALGGNAGYLMVLWVTTVVCAVLVYSFRANPSSSNRSTLAIVILVAGMMIWAMPKVRTFDCLLIVVLVLCLTNWQVSRQWGWLSVAPLSALLMINAHAALWPLVYIVGFAYLVDELLSKDWKAVRALAIAAGVSFLALFLNPYGIDAILLVFQSMSPLITDAIMECKSPLTLKHGPLGYIAIALIILSIAILVMNRKRRDKRALLVLLAISIALAAWSYRNANILVTVLALVMVDMPLSRREFSKKGKAAIGVLLALATIAALPLYAQVFSSLKEPYDPQSQCIVRACDELGVDKNSVSVFRVDSSYSEFKYRLRGYHDARAELFLESVNHKADLAGEYVTETSRIALAYYGDADAMVALQDFINRYRFDFIVTEEEDLSYMRAIGDAAESVGYRRIAETPAGDVYTCLPGNLSFMRMED